MKVGLVGGVNSSFVTLKKLVEHGFNLTCVFGYKPSEDMIVSGFNDFEHYSLQNNLNYHQFTRINDSADIIKKAELDVLFVVGVSQLVSKEILDAPSLGCIGFHPTALPKGRGRAPLAWIVKNTENGAANFFQITDVADAGPIFVQKKFDVSEEDDATSVESKMLIAIERALDSWLPELKKGVWDPVPQNEIEATEYGVRKLEDGLINWNESANSILRLIRAASSPHPGAFSYFGLDKVIVNKARSEKTLAIQGCIGRVLKIKNNELLIQTGNGLIWVSDYMTEGALPKVGERLGYLPEYEIHSLKTEIKQIKKHLGITNE